MKSAIFCALVLSVAGQADQSRPDPKTARVAVIGGGIGGVTTVMELIEAGFEDITLFEKSNDMVSSTSSMIAVRCCPFPDPRAGCAPTVYVCVFCPEDVSLVSPYLTPFLPHDCTLYPMSPCRLR